MKFSILALGAAVAGISSQCMAQIQIESHLPLRATPTRLISQNQDFFDSQSSREDDSDYYADDVPAQAEIGNAAQFNNGPRSVLEKPVATEAARLPQHAAPLEVLALTPEVGMVPVCWPSNVGCPTPNPVANYMLLGGCTQGLWDSYACQQAKQCAKIQQQLQGQGHNRYRAACAPCPSPHAISLSSGCASGTCATGPSASQCAQNVPAGADAASLNLTSGLVAASPFVGAMQAGLPVVDVPAQVPAWVQMSAYGQPTQHNLQPTATDRLPSGQPLLQLPNDVPTVPAGTVPSTTPSVQLPDTNVLPTLPFPNASPVVASRQTAPLR